MFKPAVTKHDISKASNPTRHFIASTGRNTHFRDVLEPSPPSSLNGPQRLLYSSGKNPLKRTASEVHSGPRTIKKSLGKAASMGVLTQLHDDLDFDENDFEDDINLDEDITLPVTYPSLPTKSFNPLNGLSQDSVQYPKLPAESTKSKAGTPPQKPSSNAPLPWSSSPVANRLSPPNAGMLKRDNNDKDAIDLTQESPARPIKRRSLPWADGVPSGLQTPQASKLTAASPHPWNKSASAVKQEQNAVRQKNTQIKKAAAAMASKQAKHDPKVVTKTKKGRGKMAHVFLSDEQKVVLDLVTEQKQSVFFTGSAGTGKSVLMREIIKVLRIKHARDPERVAVTASTGLAACNVSGVTLHSFAGIGLGKEPAEDLIKRIKKNNKAKSRWMRAKVLIIDEISMVDGKLFDKLEKVARGIRNDGRPFGGIQLVVTGDFFQLPPVPDGGQEATFAFDAATWSTVMQHTIGLTQVFRQKDPAFANMLNEMRVGKLTQDSINTFHKLHRELHFEDSIDATELFPTRDEVDRSNRTRMQQLLGQTFTFDALDGGTVQDTIQRDKMLANCMAPQQLILKKGAQVMLIKNLDDGLVNGSIGKVIAFMDERKYDIYREDEDAFLPAEANGMDDSSYQASRDRIRDRPGKETAPSDSRLWPLVSFQLPDGTTRQLLCVQEKWTIELPSGEVQASRMQVPLILAWALSIHKAQGQTLERVKVDLGKVFEKGQAYVALSRATSQDGLQILNFNPKKVMAHEKVRRFYDSLYKIADTKPAAKKLSNPRPSKIPDSWMGDGFDDESRLLEYAHCA